MILLNSPDCGACDQADYTGLAPYYAVDAGILTLVASVPQTVAFKHIKATVATQWGMPKSTCLNAGKSEIYPTITKSATGFTVVADEDCTFEYLCIKF